MGGELEISGSRPAVENTGSASFMQQGEIHIDEKGGN